MRLSRLIELLNRIVPEHLAEPWDHVGLQVGNTTQDIRKAMLCIDLTESVLDEAVNNKVNLIIAYHPPIFDPLKTLTDQSLKERLILKAAQARIAIYSPHTALDAAVGGVNDWLISGLGEGSVTPVKPGTVTNNKGINTRCKLVTFAPGRVINKIRTAMARAGAGLIGHYSECSYNLTGWGTFKGDQTTSPAVGHAMKLEKVEEIRLEMIIDLANLANVVAALRKSHPYEEPAFDVYPLIDPDPEHDHPRTGQGRVLSLNKPITTTTLISRIKKRLGLKHLEIGQPIRKKNIHRIGLCVGAGGSILDDAGPVDAFITGEMRHHDVLAAIQAGITIILAGHTQTERPYLSQYRNLLNKTCDKKINWLISKKDSPPTKLL